MDDLEVVEVTAPRLPLLPTPLTNPGFHIPGGFSTRDGRPGSRHGNIQWERIQVTPYRALTLWFHVICRGDRRGEWKDGGVQRLAASFNSRFGPCPPEAFGRTIDETQHLMLPLARAHFPNDVHLFEQATAEAALRLPSPTPAPPPSPVVRPPATIIPFPVDRVRPPTPVSAPTANPFTLLGRLLGRVGGGLLGLFVPGELGDSDFDPSDLPQFQPPDARGTPVPTSEPLPSVGSPLDEVLVTAPRSNPLGGFSGLPSFPNIPVGFSPRPTPLPAPDPSIRPVPIPELPLTLSPLPESFPEPLPLPSLGAPPSFPTLPVGAPALAPPLPLPEIDLPALRQPDRPPLPIKSPFLNPLLTPFQPTELGLQPQPVPETAPNRCRCPPKNPRRRVTCNSGFFEELRDGSTQFTVWRSNKCQSSKKPLRSLPTGLPSPSRGPRSSSRGRALLLPSG